MRKKENINMSKVSYANLKLKVNTEVNTFDFNNQKIEVLKYLPIQDKYDLIMITLQKAEENGIYNEVKLDMYFHLHLVYMYTNLSFTEKQKENEEKIYDTLQSNGFFDVFLETLDEDEYTYLYNSIGLISKEKTDYNKTITALIRDYFDSMPKKAESAAKIVENFNPAQFQAVLDFANAANGNRDFKTNQPIAAV